jgi:hypothetical protein
MVVRRQYLRGDSRLSFSRDRRVGSLNRVIASDLLYADRVIRKNRSTMPRNVTELDREFRS